MHSMQRLTLWMIYYPLQITRPVKEVCGYNPNYARFNVSGLPLKLGHNLKRCAAIKISRTIEDDDINTKEMTKGFLKLLDINWKEIISRQALATQAETRFNKTDLLSWSADIERIHIYVDENIKSRDIEIEI